MEESNRPVILCCCFWEKRIREHKKRGIYMLFVWTHTFMNASDDRPTMNNILPLETNIKCNFRQPPSPRILKELTSCNRSQYVGFIIIICSWKVICDEVVAVWQGPQVKCRHGSNPMKSTDGTTLFTRLWLMQMERAEFEFSPILIDFNRGQHANIGQI